MTSWTPQGMGLENLSKLSFTTAQFLSWSFLLYRWTYLLTFNFQSTASHRSNSSNLSIREIAFNDFRILIKSIHCYGVYMAPSTRVGPRDRSGFVESFERKVSIDWMRSKRQQNTWTSATVWQAEILFSVTCRVWKFWVLAASCSSGFLSFTVEIERF